MTPHQKPRRAEATFQNPKAAAQDQQTIHQPSREADAHARSEPPPEATAASGSLLKSLEGQILLLGAAVVLGYAGWLGWQALDDARRFRELLGMTSTHALFGRAAGLALGYSLGFRHSTVILINMTIETIMVLLFYPLFVFSWQHLIDVRFLRGLMARTHQAAEANGPFIRKYGLIGLFGFVWFPFWMTGPVVGCAIGFLMRLHPWLNITVVLSGTYLAIVSWALVLRELHARIEVYSAYAPLVVVGVIMAAALIRHLLRR
jgi:uncharacterized membrane protein